MIEVGNYYCRQTLVGLELTNSYVEGMSTMPYSIMIRKFGTDEYVRMHANVDVVPDNTVCSVDHADQEDRIYYISVASLVLADLPENQRFSPLYTKIVPLSGCYYAKAGGSGIEFRTKTEGFFEWWNSCMVKDPISGEIVLFHKSVHEIPENAMVHVTVEESDSIVIDEGVRRREKTDSGQLGCAADMFFGSRSIHALGAAKVVLDIIKPWGKSISALSREELPALVKRYVLKCYEFHEGSLQGAAAMDAERNILFHILFGPDVAEFILPRNLEEAGLRIQDIKYDERRQLFMLILNRGGTVEEYMMQHLGINVYGAEPESQDDLHRMKFF